MAKKETFQVVNDEGIIVGGVTAETLKHFEAKGFKKVNDVPKDAKALTDELLATHSQLAELQGKITEAEQAAETAKAEAETAKAEKAETEGLLNEAVATIQTLQAENEALKKAADK